MSSKSKKTFLSLIAVGILIAFAAGYFSSGLFEEAESKPSEHVEHVASNENSSKTDIVWTCSMHPQIQLPNPGKCPICFMDLIPLEKGGASGDEVLGLRQISLTPRSRKLAGIVTDKVKRMAVSVQTRMLGKVDYDETRMGIITAWTGGRIDKLYIDYTGSPVRKGQAMASIYSPELMTAQAELIQSVKAIKALEGSSLKVVKSTAKRTERAAREKLKLLGLSARQINAIIQRGEAADHVTLYSPLSGIVIQKDVDEGMYVKTGTPVYKIADLRKVWVILEVYESDLPWIKMGMNVKFTTEAFPGERFEGKVSYIDPMVNEKTRTIRVRLDVTNKDSKLKPGMFVKAVNVTDKKKETNLVIPASAPLVTGRRAVVYVAVPGKEGVYEGREIVLGPKAGDYYVVKYGLSEGEEVVTKGNFNIDSAVQIIAKPSMMNTETGIEPLDTGKEHAGHSVSAESTLPPFFISKIVLLKKSYEDLVATAKSGDIDASKKAFSNFFDQVQNIDGAGLKGDSSLAWKELSMLLSNDAVIGRSVKDSHRLELALSETTEHFKALDKVFSISLLAEKNNQNRIDVPESFRVTLSDVYDAYELFVGALAADNLSQAQAEIANMAEKLNKIDSGVLSTKANEIWMKSLEQINSGIEKVRTSDSIVGARSGLEPISYGMIDAVSQLGIKADHPVYEIFCPMAFDFKGAKWLQNDQKIRNPYFGKAMQECGEVQRQLKDDK
ncbi:efflux RND transporter periplasmic adaptor subunit [Maridesulfovibrio bastinii]|uniref:efflux RND transporter periplasmic adaptor subunit n=1 Tax=Maridesulfovibrio bastinii TaxID=47157 RepID=UPI00041EE3D8|nr:efflux RND transporter periplasmic adaptor subunit [Maridesulfovibrio bastinii]